MEERIVVGVDEDRTSGQALEWALARARRGNGSRTLTLASAVEYELGSAAADKVLNALDAERAEIERQWPELTIATEVASGGVLQVLTDMSQRCDLLVVGTDKTGIFKAVLLGSLGMRLAAAAKCSVAVIPGQATTGLDVVVGVDGTPESLLACEFAASEAEACGGELIVLCAGYVANPLFADLVPPVLPGRERAALLARASEHVRGLFPALSVQTRLVDGPPPRALLEEAHGAGLLVIGHHKRAKVIRRFERSVGRDVLIDMSVPVVVVHDKESNV